MNLYMFSALVNNCRLDEKLMSYPIRTQNKDRPVEVPAELLVFLCRIWIVHIGECPDNTRTAPRGQPLAEARRDSREAGRDQEWNGGEVLSHEMG